jgi:hypothetical protein
MLSAMTEQHRPLSDPARLRALAAQCRLWLIEIAVWLCEVLCHGPIGKALRATLLDDLNKTRRCIAGILGLLALQRLSAHPEAPMRAHRPAKAPRGYRRSDGCTAFRAAIRLIKSGRGLRGRMATLCAVLDNLDAWIARMATRLDRIGFVAAYVMTRAPMDALRALVRAAPAFADSS